MLKNPITYLLREREEIIRLTFFIFQNDTKKTSIQFHKISADIVYLISLQYEPIFCYLLLPTHTTHPPLSLPQTPVCYSFLKTRVFH